MRDGRRRATILNVSTAPAGPLRVLVVDSDHRVRHSLTGLICCLGRQVEVADAADAGTALRLAAVHEPDVVFVDPRLPDVDAGLALIDQLRTRWPRVRLIVMGWSEALDNVSGSLGPTTFISKGDAPNAFLEAIGSAADAAA